MRWFDLAFDPAKLPRTMTRAEWRKLDHWRRSTRRVMHIKMKEREADIKQALSDAVLFGFGVVRYDPQR